MIVSLDRRGGTIAGGGIVCRLDTESDVLRPWCRSALASGYDLAGMRLEMWDCGADMRKEPMLCLTVFDASLLCQPNVDKARAAEKRAEAAAKRSKP